MTDFYSAGFPHSEISGSMRMCRSPELIAACHVLLRLLMPRHSPCALFRLIYWFSRIMQAPFGFPSVEIVTHCFPQLLQTFAFCCLACPLLSVQFSMCRPRRRGSRGLRFRGYRKGRESSQALDRSSSSNRNIRFDLRDAGIEARISAPIGTKFQHLGSLNAETCFQSGGDSRTRTDDPLLAKQVLSQLSYTPGYEIGGPKWTRTTDLTIISRVL